MLTDPQTITVNSVAKAMPKVLTEGQHAFYQLADQTFSLDIRHTSRRVDKKARVRSLVTFTQRAVVADPLTSVNDFENVAVSVQIDRPEAGFTSTQIQQMVTGFQAWLTSTIVDKLYGRES
jgi:hypothetical protein